MLTRNALSSRPISCGSPPSSDNGMNHFYVRGYAGRYVARIQADERGQQDLALILKSVNSYTRHCGEHAAELAEGDLLGEALKTLGRFHALIVNYQGEPPVHALTPLMKEADGILAKAGRVQP